MSLNIRVAGFLAPDGSPERDYWLACLHGGDINAASKRLDEEGCRVMVAGEKPEWRDGKWFIRDRDGNYV